MFEAREETTGRTFHIMDTNDIMLMAKKNGVVVVDADPTTEEDDTDPIITYVVDHLHWTFETDVENYTLKGVIESKIRMRMQGCNKMRMVDFHREMTSLFLTEKLLKGLCRHLGFESCSRSDLWGEEKKMHNKGYILQTYKEKSQSYYDVHLQRYKDVWIGEDLSNSSINYGLWTHDNNANNCDANWVESQDNRYQAMISVLEQEFKDKSGSPEVRVLDVGCGVGYTLNRLKKQFGKQFVGLGIGPSAEEIVAATKAFGREGLEFKNLFLHQLLPEEQQQQPHNNDNNNNNNNDHNNINNNNNNSDNNNNNNYVNLFDIVITESAMCHMPPDCRRQALKQMYQLLKPGGLLWFNDVILGQCAQIGIPTNTETEVFILLRLGFEGLWTIDMYEKLMIDAGFQNVQKVDHAVSTARSYRRLAERAKRRGYEDLSEDYIISAANIDLGTFSWGWFQGNKPLRDYSEKTGSE